LVAQAIGTKPPRFTVVDSTLARQSRDGTKEHETLRRGNVADLPRVCNDQFVPLFSKGSRSERIEVASV